MLEFNLAQYKGAKPIAESRVLGETTYSVAHLTNLLPPFKSFPDVRTDAVNQTLDEPEFPTAPLSRVQAWSLESTLEDRATTARKRYSYGSDFPTLPFKTIKDASANITTETTSDASIDYKAVPELPEIDPRTVSEGNLEFASPLLPDFLKPEASSAGYKENSAGRQEIQAATFKKVYPEVRAATGHPDTDDSVSSLSADAVASDIHGSGYSMQATSPPGHKVEETRSFQQIHSDELDVYRIEAERFKLRLKRTPRIELPSSSSSGTLVRNEHIEDIDSSTSTPADLIGQENECRHAPAGPAPKPVVALEEAIAAAFFSATTDATGLSLSVQLELSGQSCSDHVLALFGESVHVDEQGRFCVRIKLDKSPQLAALLRAQHKNNLEGH
jgi:hypothetical protein